MLGEAVAFLREAGPAQGEQVVLHQDLHGGNVLQAQREPWLAIDPKPLVGEREFDTASFLRDRRWELRNDADAGARVRRRLDLLAAELGLDRDRMRGWGVAHALAWGMSGKPVQDRPMAARARWLAVGGPLRHVEHGLHDKPTTISDVRVLVTGGCGFIGSHFVKRLASGGDEVVVLDKLTYSGRKENLDGVDCDVQVGDIADPDAVARAAEGCDAIVNFAAETHVDRSILGATDFGRTEFFGTQVLLEEVRRTGARYVQVSTDEVYGDLADGGSASETDPVEPSSPYSVAKAAGDLHIPAYVRTFDVNASITRGSNTYGPNQYPEKLVPLFVTNALDGEPLPVYGDGKQIRDWLHVEDHCSGIEFVLREGRRARSTTSAAATSARTSRSRSGSSS